MGIDIHFHTFGLGTDASFEQVKEARRRYTKAFHPDRFANSPDDAIFFGQKMKEINAAYEALKAWFEDPSRNKETDASGSANDESEKWESWFQGQEKRWAEEFKEWQVRQSAAEAERQRKLAQEKRKQVVRRTKIVAAAMLGFFWIGQATSSSWVKSQRLQEAQGIISATQYDLNTHGTATSAYYQSDNQIGDKWMNTATQTRDHWRQEDQERGLGFAGLVLISLIAGWGFFSSKANRWIDSWVSGNP